MDDRDLDPVAHEPAPRTPIQNLADAISQLTDDPEWMIAALTEKLRSMRAPAPPTEAEVQFLLSSSALTPAEISRISDRVARYILVLEGADSFLSALHVTWSLEQVSSYLGKPHADILAAVDQRRLYAVKIAQRMRFPVFQFAIGHPEPLMPHLPEVIEAAGETTNWASVVAFMETRRAELVAVAAQTPRAWLLDGGRFDEVEQLLNATHRH
ncbi:hypothetical protein [Microbacterium sp. RG1]|uniref:hypothetical protein n=1 Tax=Microbacterium sp. RG1 TaxID=2489212 RepID=UPI0010CA44E9|nr:hypothetical protein [Microbacterium sp. RG1]QCQ17186.1 hypothetical protein EHF32_10875 [Microbacterium sp. RG1]